MLIEFNINLQWFTTFFVFKSEACLQKIDRICKAIRWEEWKLVMV